MVKEKIRREARRNLNNQPPSAHYQTIFFNLCFRCMEIIKLANGLLEILKEQSFYICWKLRATSKN